MLTNLLIAAGFLSLSVVIHAAGLSAALRWLRRQTISGRFRDWTWIFIRVALWMVLLHMAEIIAWAALYAFGGAMPDAQTAFYFSAVTYTTTGYGDLVLPEAWRIIGGVEALTGILLCGWSTGFFLAVVNRMYQSMPDAPGHDPARG
jgi:hypothetical protein